MDRSLLLVGSIPYDTPEEVFRKFGSALGARLTAMPDGEVGARRHWISRVHYQVFAGHPEFEVLKHPEYENGAERLHPRGPADSWRFKVRDGVDEVRFGDPGWRLGYARDALNSWFVFRTLREQGILPAGLRFQVSMPSVNSVLPPRVFAEPSDVDRVKPGYEAAVRAELETIVDRIPAEDLAIQWDCSTEMQDAYGGVPEFDPETMIERNVGQFRRLCPVVPEGAQLGFHLCFGTLGGWPRFVPDDLSGAVTLANAIIGEAGRRVDWLHIPVLDTSEESFFAPLARLEPRDTRIYLGMIHHMEGFADRLAAARKYLPDFGLGGYCGFGREDPRTLPGVLDDHLRAAELASF